MKNNIEIHGTSMYHVSEMVNVGRTNLLKGLRSLGILKEDNTPNKGYENVGLVVFMSLVGKYSLFKTVPTLRATKDGISFIQNLIIKHPELFPPKKSGVK